MSVEAAIYIKRYDLEKKRKTSTAQAHDAFGHLVLLDYNIRSGRFYIQITEKTCVKILCMFFTGVRTHQAPCMPTPLPGGLIILDSFGRLGVLVLLRFVITCVYINLLTK